MSNDKKWDEFTAELVNYMIQFDCNEIRIDALWKLIENNEEVIGLSAIIEDISNVISEIDGFHDDYLDLIEFLKKKPSRLELVDFRNFPD